MSLDISEIIERAKNYDCNIEIKFNNIQSLSDRSVKTIKKIIKKQIELYIDGLKRKACEKYKEPNLFETISNDQISDNHFEIKVNFDKVDKINTLLTDDERSKILNLSALIDEIEYASVS